MRMPRPSRRIEGSFFLPFMTTCLPDWVKDAMPVLRQYGGAG